MRIILDKLHPSKRRETMGATLDQPLETIVIQGHETWLSEVYQNFQDQVEEAFTSHKTQLHGTLFVNRIPHHPSRYQVTGELHFNPLVPCDRCSEPMVLELKIPVDVLVTTEFEYDRAMKMPQIEEGMFDAYILDEDHSLDVMALVHDSVQLALPQVTMHDVESPLCAIPLSVDPQEAEDVALLFTSGYGAGNKSSRGKHSTESSSQELKVNPFAKAFKDWNIES